MAIRLPAAWKKAVADQADSVHTSGHLIELQSSSAIAEVPLGLSEFGTFLGPVVHPSSKMGEDVGMHYAL